MIGKRWLPWSVVAAGTVTFALACASFVAQPGLGTFADDSVSYLVMAQNLSPWTSPTGAVAEAFPRETTYPPLFPALLAAAGAAHDFARAHVVTALVLAACLPALFALAGACLATPAAALAVTAGFALLPATWIQARGILSEPLFTLIFLLVLLATVRAGGNTARPVLLAALLAALALTRTVGLVVALAYAAWAIAGARGSLRSRLRLALPAIAAFVAYAVWVLVRPAETADDYARILVEHVEGAQGLVGALVSVAENLARQGRSVGEAWVGSLMLFWVEGQPLRVVLAGALGIAGIAGMALRAAQRCPDAWLTAAYLGTFLIWPFYDQMTRFIFPVVPILLLYAFYSIEKALHAAGWKRSLGNLAVLVLVATLAVPALAFIHRRAGMARAEAQVVEWYRTPDLARAVSRSRVHLGLLEDMRAIEALTQPRDRVMWVAPSYIALLANRRAVPAPRASDPQTYRAEVASVRPEYVFLSRYHPRDTLRESAWRLGAAALAGMGEVVHARRGDDGEPAAVLIRLSR